MVQDILMASLYPESRAEMDKVRNVQKEIASATTAVFWQPSKAMAELLVTIDRIEQDDTRRYAISCTIYS